jgi:hypothetical protein
MFNYIRGSLQDRFWSKVEKTDYCWNWLAGTVKGYGIIATSGGKYKFAHRLSFEMVKGEIPEGMQVLHKCDNPLCVRPSHLFLGDNDVNMQDRTNKKRHWANLRPDEFREHAKRMSRISHA